MEKNNIADFYDEYVDRQVRAGLNERHYSIRDLVAKNASEPDVRILEMGCGIGTVTGLLAAAFPQGSVLAMDMSPASIEHATATFAKVPNVRFITGDVVETPISGQFALIVLPDILEHIPLDLHLKLFKRFSQLLKEGGRVIIHSPDPYYSDWVRTNRPELMQVVDLALHFPQLISTVHDAGLTVLSLERYSIWSDKPDYFSLVLVRAPMTHAYKEVPRPRPTWFDRLSGAFKRLR
ncbi:MAG: class I SAM-dependent methyltransferase [Flavobacteriales bacterium]|nr:class I SAM-dependent methyltransferase [Flavobacteriales bacterium]